MSRTRLIRPGFFSDERMAALPAVTRLIYIGIWTLCDDAGYFERRPGEIAVSLLPYERPLRRQRLVDAALEELLAIARIRWLDCGEHGVCPTLPEHVMKGGNHAYTYKARHDSDCATTLFRSRAARGRIEPVTNESGTDQVRVADKSRSFSVSDSVSSSGLDSGRRRPLDETMEKAGGFAATLVAGKAR